MGTDVAGGARIDIVTMGPQGLTTREDVLAIEEALEIRVVGTEPVITMRTPGQDRELAAGLMLSEGLARTRGDFEMLCHLVDEPDVVQIALKHFSNEKAEMLQRSSFSNSACGVCGKKRLDLGTMENLGPLSPGPAVSGELLCSLPSRLREHQRLFAETGGLHAAALFDDSGELQAVQEDVGRHNALDKLNGWALLNHRLPLTGQIVVLSGRASFELIQKCIMARVPVVCAISAPSSYAVRLARKFGITLVGFLREGRFNIYSCPERILDQSAPGSWGHGTESLAH
ncbi:formate dehydrogenase accessory sulfurtransferase FdhD [Billgrantia endophytica]|uniref:Sulfur carrier protein FdhD n=1 Tax=Billgrantia endophytica TaxID=2033802 RepID=A0A2N7U0H2_9GAMM|nr:formate dehydrogenase accessory sulfurtransferase FdhD [Halomonas endophytica]PMR73913.1 formate dehydrogenase family accessory protein FdhD [Halomonas endophytica]